MKILMLACILLLTLSKPALAQPAAPIHANVATTHVADSARVAYDRLGQVLVAAGYDLEKASFDAEKAYYLRQANFKLPGTGRQIGYLTTIYRSSPTQPELRMALQAAVLLDPDGSATVELRGTYTLDGLRIRPIANQGGKNSPATEAWNELQRVAALLPGAPPSYRREQQQ